MEVSRGPCKLFSEPVPEDMVMEIFSRMPAECLHHCKQAYEDWNTLCSTSYFNHNLFLQRASPTIIVHRGSLSGHKLFYVDDDHRAGLKSTQISLGNHKMWLEPPSWLPIHEFTPVKFTCYGLIFLAAPKVDKNRSAVINPVTRKATFLSHYYKVEGDICGAFFHPTEREFRVLWVSTLVTLNKETTVALFELLRPRSESHPQLCWKSLSILKYRPVIDEPPVNLHERLHWMCRKYCSGVLIQYIIVFDVVKEEFSVSNVQLSRDKLTHLLDFDGYLSLWQLTDVLSIWTKEDYYDHSSWTKKYSIDVKLLHKKINIDEVSVVGFKEGALVIHWIGKGIFVYHVRQKSTKKLLFDKLKDNRYCFTSVFLHTKSVVSMTGFTLDQEYKHCPFIM